MASQLASTRLIFFRALHPPPCALSSPYTLHSSDLHLLFLLSIIPVVQLFSEASLDMMPRDRSRHSQSQEPGHINQHRSVGRLRVRSMHHPSTGFTLGFIGKPVSGIERVLPPASYSCLYRDQSITHSVSVGEEVCLCVSTHLELLM